VHLATTAIVLLAFAGSIALCALRWRGRERLRLCCTAASERLRACCSAVRTRLAPAAGRRTAPLLRTDEKGSVSDSSTAGSSWPSTPPAGTRQPVPRDRPRPGRPSVPSLKALASLGGRLRGLSFGDFSRRSVKERSFEASFREGHACSREPSGSQSTRASKVASFEGGVSAGASREASGSREPSKRASRFRSFEASSAASREEVSKLPSFETGEASRTEASCRTPSSDTLSESSRASAHRGEAARPAEASSAESLTKDAVRRMLRDMERRDRQEQPPIAPRHAARQPTSETVRRKSRDFPLSAPPAPGEALGKRVRSKQQLENARSRTPSSEPPAPRARSRSLVPSRRPLSPALSPVPGVMSREATEALVRAESIDSLRTVITEGGYTDDGCFNRSHLEQRAMQALGFPGSCP